MINIFKSIKEVFVNLATYNTKSRLRQQLLGMSDRQLLDFGFSRALIIEGVSAWPWRIDTAVGAGTNLKREGLILAPVVSQVTAPKVSKSKIRKAIKELNSYSDRELAELGVSRNNIEEVVRFGRPTVEGVFQDNRTAA